MAVRVSDREVSRGANRERQLVKVTLVLALCVCFCSGGCNELTAPDEIDAEGLDAAVNGKTVVYPEREKFTLQLDSWADAGYRWDCEISDTLIVSMFGPPTYRQKEDGPIVPGGASIATFTFVTKKAGTCGLRLIEHQRWMVEVAPRDSVLFSVSVIKSATPN
jgi:predicted secreted protein